MLAHFFLLDVNIMQLTHVPFSTLNILYWKISWKRPLTTEITQCQRWIHLPCESSVNRNGKIHQKSSNAFEHQWNAIEKKVLERVSINGNQFIIWRLYVEHVPEILFKHNYWHKLTLSRALCACRVLIEIFNLPFPTVLLKLLSNSQ